MKSVSEYRADFEAALNEIEFPSGSFKSLYEPIEYAMSAGGKRLRPVLVLMGADAYGGNVEPALPASLGIELFHNFTLLHDDVMDNSDVRRGRPTVHAKYDVNTAILSGDTMMALATEWVGRGNDDPKVSLEAIRIFLEMAAGVFRGQRLDMDFETRENVTPEEYLEMIRLKTGVLLGASVMIGSVVGGASDEDAAKMYEFGVKTGLAFQIQDDWLDTFGDQATFGKPIGGDILNGKKTYLYLTAMAEGGQNAEALKVAFGMPAGETKIKAVTRLYEKMGIGDKCRQAVQKYSSEATKALNGTSLDEEKKAAFRKVAEKLVGRKK